MTVMWGLLLSWAPKNSSRLKPTLFFRFLEVFDIWRSADARLPWSRTLTLFFSQNRLAWSPHTFTAPHWGLTMIEGRGVRRGGGGGHNQGCWTGWSLPRSCDQAEFSSTLQLLAPIMRCKWNSIVLASSAWVRCLELCFRLLTWWRHRPFGERTLVRTSSLSIAC